MTEERWMDVGRAIKTAREKAEMTQTDLADLIGVVVSTVSEWESGKYNPQIERLPAIAKALKVQVEDLVA